MAGGGKDARFWSRLARKYAARPVDDLPAYERTLDAVRGRLKSTDAVFEFGCGTGTTALKLAPSAARIVATDFADAMIAIARDKAKAEGAANVAFEVATPETAPYPDAAFDVVLGFNVLHLVPDRTATLNAVRRLLKPGGLFISKTPCLGELTPLFRAVLPVMQAIGQAPHVGFFTGAELEREIAAAGFEIIERARHGSGKGKDPRPYLVARKM